MRLSIEDKKQVEIVKCKAYEIERIENPCEAAQHAAAKLCGSIIRFLYAKGITPSEKTLLAAVKSNPNAIQYIPVEQQTAAVQTLAFETAIRKKYNLPAAFLSNVSSEVVALVMDGNASAIADFPSLPEDIQVFIVMSKPEYIQHIRHPAVKTRVLQAMKEVEI